MKTLGFLFVLSLAFLSCNKTQKDSPELKTYKDPKYPFNMKYIPKKMNLKYYEPELEVPEIGIRKRWVVREISHQVSLEVNLSDEFPQEVELYDFDDLYEVIVYDKKNFKGFYKSGGVKYEEGDLNGTPAFVNKDAQGKPRVYTLIVPGLYLDVWLGGVDYRHDNPQEISQERSDRVEQLTYEMIRHFKWEQKIDTNSEEFKAWKKHIWEILKGQTPPQN